MLDWGNIGRRKLTAADRQLQQDVLFANIRTHFPDLTEDQFRSEIMAPVCAGIFALAIDSVISDFPEGLSERVFRSLFPDDG